MKLLLLILPPLLLLFTTSLAQSEKDDDDHCLTSLPYTAMHHLRFGLDLTIVDVFPLKDMKSGGETPSSQTLSKSPSKLPLFAPFTCANASHRWGPDPSDNSRSGVLPDQITELYFYLHSAPISTVQTYRTIEGFRGTLQSTVQLQDELGVMAGSPSLISGTKDFWAGRTLERMVTVRPEIRLRLDVPHDENDNKGTLFLSKELKAAIEKLKEKKYSAETQKEFFGLFEQFGTHYYQEHTYGAFIVLQMSIEDRYFKVVGPRKAQEIVDQFRVYLVKTAIRKEVSVPPPAISDDRDFIEEARQENHCSFWDRPSLIQLRDPLTIADVLDAGATTTESDDDDDPIADEVRLALDDYMAKAELRLLVQSLKAVAGQKEATWMLKLSSAVFDFQKIISRAEVMISKEAGLDADEVEKVKEEGEKYIRFAESCSHEVLMR
ncbi:hypothetical protein TYRP_001500 [Tyrophagus putrescentiae]|nr:hypothetical protein TYRP_001500 [Tyrophagus putrescentiae]